MDKWNTDAGYPDKMITRLAPLLTIRRPTLLTPEQIEAVRARKDPRTEDLSQEGDAMVDALCDSHLQALRERRQLAEALKAERALVSCYKLHTQPSDALLDKLAETHEVAALAQRILKEEE